MPRYETYKGLFGQDIHYKDGVKVGESWEGLISGTRNHYDANGTFVGSSSQGILADEVHYDANGVRIGDSYEGFLGTNHYNDNGYIGSSYEGLFGTITDINDNAEPFNSNDNNNW